MPSKPDRNSGSSRWLALDKELKLAFPHLHSVLTDNRDFRELRLKARDDGTIIAICKRFGSDGGPEVCFGTGYDCTLALMSIDAAIQGGNWRFDKPWKPS